ncbi:MAG: T9SS type A sorting domain-containing protein [Sphingobacteriaceae bacterium]|nr:T9SS type A sorting domain-containing protein [Sphingobacteriaceae bacterium]
MNIKKLLTTRLLLLLLLVLTGNGLATAQYCASNATNTADSRIAKVKVGNDSITSPVGTGNCAGYTDYTASAAFTLRYGVGTAATITYGTCGLDYASYAKIFVDLNNDSIFTANEMLGEGPVVAGTPLLANLVLPATTAHLGVTLMRVVLRESGTTTTTEACGTYTYGETQDFSVNLLPPPNCLPPTALLVNTSTSASATLAWTEQGTATAWDIEYGPVGFNQGTGTTLAATSNPFTISGLTANTGYQAFVRANCGATNGTSAWSGPITFQTPCAGPISGTLTVNASATPSTTSFTSLASVFTSLSNCGINGPVVINMVANSGPYNGEVIIANIPGNDSTNTITINGNGNTIQHLSTNTNQRATLRVDGIDYLTVNNLIIKALGEQTGEFGFGVHLLNSADFNTFNNITVESNTTSTSTNFAAFVASNSNTSATAVGAAATNLTLTNSTMIGGYYGITLNGATSAPFATGANISNNTVQDFYLYGVWIRAQINGQFNNNDIFRTNRAAYSTFYGIYLNSRLDNSVFNANRIHDDAPVAGNSFSSYPIYGTGAVGSAGNPYRITNNAVYNIRNTGITYGIYFLSTSNFHNIHHNTVIIDNQAEGGTSTKAAYYNTSTTAAPEIDLKNNIFYINNSNGGSQYGIWFSSATPVFTSNHNNIFVSANATAGIKAAVRRGTTNYLTLTDWKAAFSSAFDQNSVDADPVITNPTIGNITPLSSTIDNLGVNVGVTTDLNGVTRSATTPDLGAVEFSGIASDLALLGGSLSRNLCYSTNDSIDLTIRNVVGGSINFSTTPLTVNWSVNGPANSTGSTIINTGTLASNANLTIRLGGVNMSIAGTYTGSAAIGGNSFNINPLNDSIAGFDMIVDPLLFISPNSASITDDTTAVDVRAFSRFMPVSGHPIITEICHFKTATGAPTNGWPSYLIADDYIEVSWSPGADLGGYTLEQWSTTALSGTFTFPGGTLIGPNGTAIIAVGQLGSSVPSPADYYYHGNGTFTSTWGSTTAAGRVIKNPSGTIVEAVGYGTYTFPAAANVDSTLWSGNTPAVSSSGNRLEGAYTRSATNWINSGTSPQTPNVLNPGIVLPTPPAVPGFTWTLNGAVVDTVPEVTFGPFSTSGTFTYIANYATASCGLLTDSIVVTVQIPVVTCPITTTPTATGGIACGPNGAVLSAIPGDTAAFIVWSDSSNTLVGTGSPFTTLPLTANYNFRAHDAKISSGIFSPGPPTSIATGGFGNFSNGMYFTAFSSFFWDSVTFRANGPVTGVIRIWDSNPTNFPNAKLIQSKNFSVSGAGDIQVPVGMAISQGSYYVNLGFNTGSAQLWRSTGGAVYPYTVPDLMRIDSAWLGANSTGNLTRVYYFLDWKVSALCFGTGVNALATTAPSTLTTLPFAETFTNGIACDWVRTQNTGSTGWVAGNSTSLSSTGFTIPAHNDFVAVNANSCNCNSDNDRLITPRFNFGTFGTLNNLSLTFEYFMPGNAGSRGTVLVSTDGGTTYSLLDSLPSTSTTAWAVRTINLNSLAGQADVRFAFRHSDGGGAGDGLAIDDIEITSSCAGTEVRVEVVTDIFGTETTWVLRDAVTNTVYATGGPYDDVNPYNAAAATHIAIVCVPDSANVTFKINDSYGDGLFDGTNTGTFDVSIDCGGTQTSLFSGSGAFPYGGGAANVPSWDSLNFQVLCPPAIPQVSVTFRVDMSRENVSSDGVHIAGSFQGWNPSATPMVSQGNGIYTYTATLDANTTYEYKFINGNQWGPGFDESVPAACAQNGNRFVVVDTTTITTPMVCFGRCEACGVSVFEAGSLGSAIRMYPNPTSAETHIAYVFETPSELNVTIYDARGKMVSQIIEKDITTGTIKLNVQGWAEGIYHVRMFNGFEQISRQLVVTK